jgi:hypothetical protein
LAEKEIGKFERCLHGPEETIFVSDVQRLSN